MNDGNIAWLVLEGNSPQFQGTYTSATPILDIINLKQGGGSINVKNTTGGNDNGKAEENENKKDSK
jgi:hypothetical protein